MGSRCHYPFSDRPRGGVRAHLLSSRATRAPPNPGCTPGSHGWHLLTGWLALNPPKVESNGNSFVSTRVYEDRERRRTL
jgi:hypothetical protein